MQLVPVIFILALGSSNFVLSFVAESTQDAFLMPEESKIPTKLNGTNTNSAKLAAASTPATSENTSATIGSTEVFDPTFISAYLLKHGFEMTTSGACIPKPWLSSTLLRLNESRSACGSEWQLLKEAHWDVIKAYKNCVATLHHVAAAECPGSDESSSEVCKRAFGVNSTDAYVKSIVEIHETFKAYEETVDQVVPVLSAPLEDAALPCVAAQEPVIYHSPPQSQRNLSLASMYINGSICAEAQEKQTASDAAIKKLEAAAAGFGMDVGAAMAEMATFLKAFEEVQRREGSRVNEENVLGELEMALEELEKACGRMVLDTTSMNACDFRVRVENAVDAVCGGRT